MLSHDKMHKQNQQRISIGINKKGTEMKEYIEIHDNQATNESSEVISQLIHQIKLLQETVQKNGNELQSIKIQYSEMKTELANARETIASLKSILSNQRYPDRFTIPNKARNEDEQNVIKVVTRNEPPIVNREKTKETDVNHNKKVVKLHMRTTRNLNSTVTKIKHGLKSWHKTRDSQTFLNI